MRVLIAEDDDTSRLVLEMVLEKWGHEVIVTSDGDAAWEVLKADDSPPLAILDRLMPGKDGLELCQQVRELNQPNPPYIILLTIMGRRDDVVAGLYAGADDYVSKPFDPNELRARIQVAQRVIGLQSSLSNRVRELEDALSQVKTLQGILPICMHCHKIRSDEESWERLESYIQTNTEATFSHGVCPECLTEHYPQLSGLAGDDSD